MMMNATNYGPKNHSAAKMVFVYVVLILMAMIMLVPFIWMLSASLKVEKDVFAYPIIWIPRDPQW